MCLAIPGRITEIVDPTNQIAKVDVAGVVRKVNVALIADDPGGPVSPGDWVLIHVGFAMSRIDEAEATATLQLLREMGEMFEEELQELEASVIE